MPLILKLNARSPTPEFTYINAPPAPYKGMQLQESSLNLLLSLHPYTYTYILYVYDYICQAFPGGLLVAWGWDYTDNSLKNVLYMSTQCIFITGDKQTPRLDAFGDFDARHSQ